MKNKIHLAIIATIISFSYASFVYAIGITIVPSSGPGYASGKPCTIITLTDDGTSYEESGTFNSELECKISYNALITAPDATGGETSPFFTLVTSFVNAIRTALQNGTAILQ
jgi:hypothetical protein